jgi:hypothetical protein
MNKLINKLPIENLYHIMSYSYKFQPIDLRNDIISFYETNNNIKNIFMIRYNNLSYISIYQYLKHLLFHIVSYLTGLKNKYNNCPYILFDVYKRNYMLKNNKNSIIENIENNIYSQNHFNFNYKMYWGLLTPEERNKFIKLQISFDINRMP